MGKTEKQEKFCLQLSESSKHPEKFAEIINKFEKVCLGEMREDELHTLCRFEKQYGISFKGEDDKEIGEVYFENPLDYRKFCENLEEVTTTFNGKGLPKIKYNNISDPFPFFSYSIGGKDYNHITREDFQMRFPEYPLGNVDAKPVVRCIYGDLSDVDDIDRLYMHEGLEIKYYGYDERNKIKPGYTEAEFGFLVNIAGNEVFVYDQQELKELLNSLCLGEEELCQEKVLVNKKTFNINDQR